MSAVEPIAGRFAVMANAPEPTYRLAPHNIEAEQALLGALLANNKAFERVGEYLAPDHFADPVHGRIFHAIKRKISCGLKVMSESINIKSVQSEARKSLAIRFLTRETTEHPEILQI
jgi:replicative DNA helicase